MSGGTVRCQVCLEGLADDRHVGLLESGDIVCTGCRDAFNGELDGEWADWDVALDEVHEDHKAPGINR